MILTAQNNEQWSYVHREMRECCIGQKLDVHSSFELSVFRDEVKPELWPDVHQERTTFRQRRTRAEAQDQKLEVRSKVVACQGRRQEHVSTKV